MSPRTTIQNEALREQSKTALREAAFSLFAKNGYDKTSIAQIANAAGVSKGLVYNYFSSKEDLLKAIFIEILEQFDYLFVYDENENPKVLLKQMLDATFKYFEAGSNIYRLIFQLVLQKDTMETIIPVIENIIEAKLKRIKPIFKALGFKNPETETLFLGALLDGVSFGYLTVGKDYPLKAIKRRIYEHYKIDDL